MKNNAPLIGAHVSAEGGAWNAIENIETIGGTAVQFFGASPRMWHTRTISASDAKKFREAKAKSTVQKVYLHASYLVNLASVSEEIYEKSIKNLSEHLKIGEMIEADGLIFHVGSGKGMSSEEALAKEVSAMKRVLRNIPGTARLIMENSAGGGAKVGSGIEEMAYLYKKIGSERVKICFDTAHAFEAGIISEYTEKNIRKLFDEWDEKVGIEEIVVLHINDSKTTYGSHHDRHENIGEGKIGIEGFRALAKEKRLWDKAWILEVPGFDGNGPDKKNINIIKSLLI
jgi:deoxyribonuclease-4